MSTKRKLIPKYEGQISWLQIIGFILILLSVLYFIGKFIYSLTQNSREVTALNLSAEEVAVLFFIIMLGFAFAFPDLLQDQNKGLSTMRIVTFMMINVICMLLLKVGWNCKSFEDIGINGYWMGIIAFVFGAKAAQTYFENITRSAAKQKKPDSYSVSQPTNTYSTTNNNPVPTPAPGIVNHP